MSDVTQTSATTQPPAADTAVENEVEQLEGDAPTATQLEEEGDIAADYIEELLDIMDLDGDI